jgi:hypothetical protein
MFTLFEHCIELLICSREQSWGQQLALPALNVHRNCFWISYHVWSRSWSPGTPKTDVLLWALPTITEVLCYSTQISFRKSCSGVLMTIITQQRRPELLTWNEGSMWEASTMTVAYCLREMTWSFLARGWRGRLVRGKHRAGSASVFI